MALAFLPGTMRADFASGDVFAGVGGGRVFRYDQNGNLLQTFTGPYAGSETTGMAFDTSGHLYSTNFEANKIVEYAQDGTVLNASFGSGFNADPESMLLNKSGHFYVGQADGAHTILEFDGAGTLVATHQPTSFANRGTDWIDLASDQKTMFYDGEGRIIKRFDVSTNTQLADFYSGGTELFALRLLSDGSILAANGFTGDVIHVDSGGNLIHTYHVQNGGTLFALNIDPDGTSFWTADIFSTEIYHIDIATGTILKSWKANKDGATEVAGLSVFGEITQGGPGPGPGTVPEPSTLSLLGTAAGFAAWRLRKTISRG